MLTAAGLDVVQRARRIVADVEQMREAARRSRDPESGTLRLGVFPTLGPYLLPHVVPTLRAVPQLELLLVEEKERRAPAAPARRQSWMRRCWRCRCTTTSCMRNSCSNRSCWPPGSIRWPATRSTRRRGCRTKPCCSRTGTACATRRWMSAACPAREKSGFRATSLETLRQMVAAGVGVTLLPALSVPRADRAAGEHPPGAVRGTAPSRRIALVWRKSSALDAFLHQLGDAIGSATRASSRRPRRRAGVNAASRAARRAGLQRRLVLALRPDPVSRGRLQCHRAVRCRRAWRAATRPTNRCPPPGSRSPAWATPARRLAGFSVEARVLGREDYRFDREADYAPTDLALGWGRMTEDAVVAASTSASPAAGTLTAGRAIRRSRSRRSCAQ